MLESWVDCKHNFSLDYTYSAQATGTKIIATATGSRDFTADIQIPTACSVLIHNETEEDFKYAGRRYVLKHISLTAGKSPHIIFQKLLVKKKGNTFKLSFAFKLFKTGCIGIAKL